MANPWRYTGGYRDAATGLYKLGHRFYDPATARWTQQDPTGVGNRYAYTNCNPVNATDHSGMAPSGDCWLAVAGFLFSLLQAGGKMATLLGFLPAGVAWLVGYFGGVALDTTSLVTALQGDPSALDVTVEVAKFLYGIHSGLFPIPILDCIGVGIDVIDVIFACFG